MPTGPADGLVRRGRRRSAAGQRPALGAARTTSRARSASRTPRCGGHGGGPSRPSHPRRAPPSRRTPRPAATSSVAEVEPCQEPPGLVEELDLRLESGQRGLQQQPGEGLGRRLGPSVGGADGCLQRVHVRATGACSDGGPQVLRRHEPAVERGVHGADEGVRRQEPGAVDERPQRRRDHEPARQPDEVGRVEGRARRPQAATGPVLLGEPAQNSDLVEQVLLMAGGRVEVVDEREAPDASGRPPATRRRRAVLPRRRARPPRPAARRRGRDRRRRRPLARAPARSGTGRARRPARGRGPRAPASASTRRRSAARARWCTVTRCRVLRVERSGPPPEDALWTTPDRLWAPPTRPAPRSARAPPVGPAPRSACSPPDTPGRRRGPRRSASSPCDTPEDRR